MNGPLWELFRAMPRVMKGFHGLRRRIPVNNAAIIRRKTGVRSSRPITGGKAGGNKRKGKTYNNAARKYKNKKN